MARFQTVFIQIMLCLFCVGLAGCHRAEQQQGPVAVGKPAADFTLTDTDGTTWTLSSLQGKVVFINFWATWCPPCRSELTSMEELRQAKADSPFQMLTILVNDDPRQAVKLSQSKGLAFPILIDTVNAAGTYGITGVPETFIVGPDGILREKVIGPLDWNSPKAKKMIRKHMP